MHAGIISGPINKGHKGCFKTIDGPIIMGYKLYLRMGGPINRGLKGCFKTIGGPIYRGYRGLLKHPI